MTGRSGALPVRSGRRTYPRSAPCLPARTDGVSPKCDANWTIRSWGTWCAGGGGGTRLLRIGVGHRLPCRRNRGGLQREKGGCARPPPPLPHHRPDRPGPRHPPSSRKRPRSRRGRHPRRPPYGPNTPTPSPHKGRDPHRRRLPQQTVAGRPHSLKVECAVPAPSGRPAAVRSKAENDGAARRREPITSKPVGSRSRGMPAVASYPPETRSGANANRRSGPGRSGPLDRVRIPGHRRQRANGPA